MIPKMRDGRRGLLALAFAAATIVPALAQAPGPGGPPPNQPPPKKHHHHGDIGAAIGAGVVGGLVGGALLGGQRQAPDYAPRPAYAPPPPPPPTYDDADDEPECRVVRRPVYDEDGEVVEYRTRRVCR